MTTRVLVYVRGLFFWGCLFMTLEKKSTAEMKYIDIRIFPYEFCTEKSIAERKNHAQIPARPCLYHWSKTRFPHHPNSQILLIEILNLFGNIEQKVIGAVLTDNLHACRFQREPPLWGTERHRQVDGR